MVFHLVCLLVWNLEARKEPPSCQFPLSLNPMETDRNLESVPQEQLDAMAVLSGSGTDSWIPKGKKTRQKFQTTNDGKKWWDPESGSHVIFRFFFVSPGVCDTRSWLCSTEWMQLCGWRGHQSWMCKSQEPFSSVARTTMLRPLLE